MKILHIASDNKFIDQAYDVFETAFPKSNSVWVFSKNNTLSFVKLDHRKIITFKLFKRWTPKKTQSDYNNYDLIVFHSFSEILYPEIFNIPKEVPTIWLGWGYDYYDLIRKPTNLTLPETKKIASRSYRSLLRSTVRKVLRITFKLAGISKPRKKAIERLSLFSPVLPNEYDMVRQSRSWKIFPEYARWNYGTIEDHLIKGFEGEQVDGNAILVGNSASPTCNHKETLDFLNSAGIEERQIIAPLSYGDKAYGDKITAVGVKYFGERFNTLKKFIPIQDYVATIKQCGYVIMNHKRQQAVGNIVIMLYLGARVFLREENPTYPFLQNIGIVVSSVQEIEKDISLLNKPLSTEEKDLNKRLVSEYWSRDSGVARTQALVKRAMALADKNSRVPRGSV